MAQCGSYEMALWKQLMALKTFNYWKIDQERLVEEKLTLLVVEAITPNQSSIEPQLGLIA
jgi:hypothetical protein